MRGGLLFLSLVVIFPASFREATKREWGFLQRLLGPSVITPLPLRLIGFIEEFRIIEEFRA